MGGVFSAVFYVVAFALSAFLIGFGHRRRSKIFIALGFLIPILIGGFRYNVGADFSRYLDKYADIINPLDTLRWGDNLEFTFTLFSNISHWLTSSPVIMFMIYSATTVIGYYIAIRMMRVKYVGISMFFYLSIFFLNSFNIVRQGAAIAVASIALAYLMRNNVRGALLTTILASCIHLSTGIIMLPVIIVFAIKNYRFIKIKRYMWYLYAIIIACFLTVLFATPIISFAGTTISNYTDMFGRIDLNFFHTVPSLGFIFKYLVAIIGLILVYGLWPKMSKIDRKIAILVSWGAVIYALGIWQNELQRPGLYLIALTPILYSMIIDMKRKYSVGLSWRTISAGVMAGCALFVFASCTLKDNGYYIYRTVFDNSEYHNRRIELGI